MLSFVRLLSIHGTGVFIRLADFDILCISGSVTDCFRVFGIRKMAKDFPIMVCPLCGLSLYTYLQLFHYLSGGLYIGSEFQKASDGIFQNCG
jgi:hypothetical protein